MKNYFWLAFAASFFFAASGFAQSIYFLTYNIRLDVASDGADAWPERRDFLAAQIRFFEAEIFGTQEGLPHQITFLEQKFPDFERVGEGRDGDGQGESAAIFFDKKRFKRIRSRTFWLSTTPDSVSMGWDAACRRVCTAALLKEKRRPRRSFWVFNCHLDHVGQTARRESVALILREIEAMNTQKRPVILMGDFNAEPSSEVVAAVKKQLFDSREKSAAPPFGPTGTFNGFRHGEAVTKLIDYIFVSETAKVRRFGVLSDSKNLHYPSDHLPVFAEIEF